MTADRLPRATPDNWMFPPDGGWTYEQVKDLELPYDWELVDGAIVVRGTTHFWHDRVRNRLALALSKGERPPLTSDAERCVLLDEQTVVKPDIVVYDKTGLDVFTLAAARGPRVLATPRGGDVRPAGSPDSPAAAQDRRAVSRRHRSSGACGALTGIRTRAPAHGHRGAGEQWAL